MSEKIIGLIMAHPLRPWLQVVPANEIREHNKKLDTTTLFGIIHIQVGVTHSRAVARRPLVIMETNQLLT